MLQYAMAMETDNFSIDKIVGDLKLYHIALIDDNSRRREFSINAYDGTRDTVGSRCYIWHGPTEGTGCRMNGTKHDRKQKKHRQDVHERCCVEEHKVE